MGAHHDILTAVRAHRDQVRLPAGRLMVIGAGKASAPMEQAVESVWGHRI